MTTEVITPRKYQEAKESAERMRTKLAKMREEGNKITKIGMRSVGIGGVAALVGFAEGKAELAGDPTKTEMFGMPLGLTIAAAGTLLNVGGYAGDEQTSDLVQAAADGGLAAYAFQKGKEMGLKPE